MTLLAFAVILTLVGGILFWWGLNQLNSLPTWDAFRFLPVAPGAALLLLGVLLLAFLWHRFGVLFA